MKIENTFLFFRDWKAENTKKDTKLLEMPKIVQRVHFCLSGNFAGLNQKLTPSRNKFIINFFYKIFNNGTVFWVIHNLPIYVVILEIASIFRWRLFWYISKFSWISNFTSCQYSSQQSPRQSQPDHVNIDYLKEELSKKLNFHQIFFKKDQNEIFQFFSINIFSKKF